MDTRLQIDVSRLDPGGETLEGEVDAVDLAEELVRPFGGLRYCLSAQAFGTELLVRGHLEQDFDLVCCRCGLDFDTTIKVDDFTLSYPFDETNPIVDLTDDVRESILLALPNYPSCPEGCKVVESSSAAPEGDDRWKALDQLVKK